ncbi:MAG: hypothetical protein CVT98_07470 [Bacteroidetes bacterium HGW-Bacteroidetes-15]|nr:MAG: hypothetical protein CVT98_07470 [Bacteroidetes bacterium HGW-Bacteroidetes-15]
MLHKTEVLNALLKVDQNILKLDSVFDSTIKKLNQPHKNTTVDEIVRNLRQFNGNFTLQTLFVRGSHNGEAIDNTTPEELESIAQRVRALGIPVQVSG